jgi:hypothetical protein
MLFHSSTAERLFHDVKFLLVRFPYYARLSNKEKEVYRRSDALTELRLPSVRELRALVPPVESALLADDRKAVEVASKALVDAVLVDLNAPPVITRVLAKRPKGKEGDELHGLYVLEEGKMPVLRVWMRTAEKKKPVALKTFIRTVMHEVVHHLDFTVYDLDPSFHCEGFFKRESHLARQLLIDPAKSLAVAPKGQLSLL